MILFFYTVLAFAAPSAPPAKPQVFVFTLNKTQVSDDLRYPAVVQAKNESIVLSETDGVVEKINVSLGQKVRKGQTLLYLKNSDPVYQYAAFPMRAAIDGVVARIEVRQGSSVIRGQRLGLVSDPTKLIARVEVPSNDVPLLRRGQKGTFRANNSSEDLAVEVIGLSPAVDPKTGTASAELNFIKSGNKEFFAQMHSGILGEIHLSANTRDVYLIPATSVLYREGKTWVRIVDENKKILRKEITLGPRTEQSFEVSGKDLSGGLTIVERTSRFLADGDEVEIATDK